MRPVVLCFSGLDPSGGAGLQADIEAIGAQGAHAAVVCTALTIQDTRRVYGFQAIDPAFLRQQADKVLADLPVAVIKCGMLANPEVVAMVREVCVAHPHITLVLDPVLAANSGGSLADPRMVTELASLFPHAALITPNSLETRWLAAREDLDAALTHLHDLGAKAILLKGGHEPGNMIRNLLSVDGKTVQTSQWPRLPHEFHGSGCTLASAIAGALAHGLALPVAVTRAEVWLQSTLTDADLPHPDGQAIPKRVRSDFA
ncbi:MAG: hydroxymethylpyrimidine/phosphomethylpyrimidine kinase [Fluviicoccus sp.]|uniref:bifunctional hydroxymethylpyrimidine kinase/phosphomethylpyrimidine kinase n=1 Tax=Fluviicoccus sp. TaxID=2003552 RepID=UPI0027283FA2|nr:hydroxymethylpyrimidine/phosphomethylpyrimidine kinase [Fluviicoccus sp.]MDO8330404.1 hydroxymethylpyrimidine/phosphomethylpyrimidine kinase [Fluviicoccus sp.]